MSHARISESIRLWQSELPSVKPYYAVKCNPDRNLMRYLSDHRVGFDCASAREIQAALSVGARPEHIVYANPCKRKEDILDGLLSNVNMTVIDSHEEIHKLYEMGWKGQALLRLRVDDEGSLVRFGEKFGAAPEEVTNLANYAAIKNVRICGISFHVGSGCGKPSLFGKAVDDAIRTIPLLHKAGHKNASVIDIGGGFSPEPTSFLAAAASIREALPKSSNSLRFIAEPGRFFAARSQDFFVSVIGKKPGPRGGWRYTLDDSLYGQFSCIPFDQARPRWLRVRSPDEAQTERKRTPAVLYGRTCDSVDMIAVSKDAEELEVGDWLWWPHMGAYTTVTATEFNGFPTPQVRILEKHAPVQLPSLSQIEESAWPSDIQYVSPVKVPEMQ